MKNEKIILILAVCAIILVAALYAAYSEFAARLEPAIPTVNIGEYIFCVEDAIGDSYNVRIHYSLKRQDGEEINPEIRFGSLSSSDGLRTLSGSIEYSLSEDGKTIWIEEEKTSPQKYDSKTLHTVTLNNLTFGDDSVLEPIEGTWYASFRIQVNEEHLELLGNEIEILDHENNNYYRISSIQISDMGIHIEMRISDNDINHFMDRSNLYLVMKNGTIVNDLDLHRSIRGKNAPFKAVIGTRFDEPPALDLLYAIVICGHEIIVETG